MPKRSRKPRLPDPAEAAFQIIQAISGEATPGPAPEQPTALMASGKDPAAVALGRKGGLKGGPARAAKMTKKQRSESARKAAMARWKQAAKDAGRGESSRHA